MYRKALDYLTEWKNRKNRKPLVIRGARQTGKSTLVRLFTKTSNIDLIEINFEEHPEYKDIFSTHDIEKIIQLIEIRIRKKIRKNKSCIFLDEIQNHPRALITLRYFFERRPDLIVIAAGSLLDFLLEDHSFSMPVGRIEYLFLGPMTFEEFLIAEDNAQLLEYISNVKPEEEIPGPIHAMASEALGRYCVLGGMPEVVKVWLQEKSFLEVEKVKHAIINTFRDDFNKYKTRANTNRLQKTFDRFPRFIGKKIVYSQIDNTEKSRELEGALHLLEQARIIYRVNHSSGNGVPLGAEKQKKKNKGLFLDVGLLCGINGLTIHECNNSEDVMHINAGEIAEQYIGQHLLYMNDFYRQPELYYWAREKPQSHAEVDYLVSRGPSVIPIEVKAGKSGTLRSLHVFMQQKKYNAALRFNAEPPSILDVTTSIAGPKHSFTLISLPLYMIEQWKRFI